MPVISRFFGITIKLYFNDHPPPHLHAEYGEHEALVDLQALVVIGGYLPPRALGMVIEWAARHQADLLDLWSRASSHQALYRLPPLD